MGNKDKQIEKALRSARASMKMEGFEITENLVKSIRNNISIDEKEKYLKKTAPNNRGNKEW